MLDNMYWIFHFLKDKCDFLTLTTHLLEKNKQQKPKTLKFSNRGFGFCFSCFKKKSYCRDQSANRKLLKGKSIFFGLQLEGSHVNEGYGLEEEFEVTGHLAQDLCKTAPPAGDQLKHIRAPVGNPSH